MLGAGVVGLAGASRAGGSEKFPEIRGSVSAFCRRESRSDLALEGAPMLMRSPLARERPPGVTRSAA
jgi:hypothetical protein